MERRAFIRSCAMYCAGGVLLAAMAESCAPVYYAKSEATGDKIKVAKSEFTDERGKARSFVVVRNEKLAFPVCIYSVQHIVYVALSMECTHSSCELQPNKTSLVCPCHGSEFSNRGKVLNPPAEKDLQSYLVSADHENIYIQL